MAKISETSPVRAAISDKKKGRRKPKLNKQNNKKITDNVKNVITTEASSNMKVENDTADLGVDKKVEPSLSSEQFAERFPVFKDEVFVEKFRGVNMTNNQKGRIRTALRDSLKGISDSLLPDVIHTRIQNIVKETASLTEAELRKIRILYNMLKTAVDTKPTVTKVKKNKKSKGNRKKKDKDNNSESETKVVKEEANKMDVEKVDDVKETIVNRNGNDKKDVNQKKDKVKGIKRYVVFVGNLPLDVDKEKLMKHFKEIKDYIADVRIPEPKEGKRSSIAYLELKDEVCYELALAKHHSMFGSKRINVLYTAQQNSNMSKTEAKGKGAKLIALKKSGKLAGSISLNRKRNQRRMKAKLAKAKLEAEA